MNIPNTSGKQAPAETGPEQRAKRGKVIFPALRHRNFQYFWFGQCISLLGTWMQSTAQQWLVYTLTKSAFLLGILGVGQFGPMMLLSLLAGVFVDRFPRKKILLFTQTALMIQALLLAALVYLGHVRYWQVLALATVMGLINTLDMPARQSFIIELVGREDLPNAIALNSSIVNLARILGPAVSALLMARFGAGLCFLLNGISFIPVIAGILLIKPLTRFVRPKQKAVLADIIGGLKYIAASPLLLSAILSMLAVGTFAMNMPVLIPVFADRALHRGVHGYGMLMSASGIGSLVGSLLLASRGRTRPGRKVLFASALLIALFMMAMNFMHAYFAALLTITLIGFCNIIFMNTANSTVQLNSSNEYRGRVMSVYTLCFAGTTPLGNFFAGSLTERFGPGTGFFMCGLVTALLVLPVAAAAYFKKPPEKDATEGAA